MSQRMKNALYISSPAITPADVERFYRIFDTEVESAMYDPVSDYIRAIEGATWALNLAPKDIYARHLEEVHQHPVFLRDPVVIMDDQTAKDESLLLLYPEHGDGGDILQEMRVAPRSLTPVLQNLEISNMDFYEVSCRSIYMTLQTFC